MRHEFSKPTKREALKRSGMFCEAVGAVYGLEPGQRCNAPLSHGVEFDHYPVPATERDSDGLENCVACCKTCHGYKTRTFDIPVQAKTKRVSDKHLGIRKPSRLQSRGFPKAEPQRTATTPLSRNLRRTQ
jgi:5-methylcytosine-specific restriction protein A